MDADSPAQIAHPAPSGPASPFRGIPEAIPLHPFGAKQALLIFVIVQCGEIGMGVVQGVINQFIRFGMILDVMSFLASAALLVAVSHYFIRYRAGETFRSALGWEAGSRRERIIAAGVGFGLALTVVAPSVVRECFFKSPRTFMEEFAGTPEGFRYLFLGAFIVPFTEEFLFRGVLYSGILRATTSFAAGGIVTLLFVGIHVPQLWPDFLGMLVLLPASLACLLARQRTGCLGPAIALHLTYNVTLMAMVGLASLM